MPAITELMPDDIVVRDRLRGLNPEIVERLKESIGSIGLKTPLSVRFLNDDEGYQLVTGRHRLQAAIEVGLKWVPVREETGSELDARMWEIAENLHRAELTALERGEHVAEWIRLVEEREKEVQSGQVAPIESKRSDGRGHRHEGGINGAARKIGVEHREARRALKVDGLHPEAKAEAKALHLDDNQSALLKAAKQPSKEDQIRALREHAARRDSPAPHTHPAPEDTAPVNPPVEPAAPASEPGTTPAGASLFRAADLPEAGDREGRAAGRADAAARQSPVDAGGAGGSPAPRVSWKPSPLLDFNLDTALLREAIAEVKAWHPSDLDYQIEERILDAMGAPRRCDLTPLADLDHAVAIVPAEWRIVASLGEHAFGSRKSEAALIKGKTRIVASASYAAVAVTEAALRAWLFEITGEEPSGRAC